MNILKSKNAPEAVGPYSQAIEVNRFVFCSGQIGIDPSTGELLNGLDSQIKQIFKNIRAILSEADLNISNVVKTTVFLKDMSDFVSMNKIYEEEFAGHRPARSTVEVSALPKGAIVEIEVVAFVDR